MAESDGGEQELLEKIRLLRQEAQATQGTGEPSLDLLLAAMEPARRLLVQNLAVPHWFDDRVVDAVKRAGPAPSSPYGLDEIVGLSFVRAHPRGYAYHDLVRGSLLRQLIREEPERVRRISRLLVDIFDGHQHNSDEDVCWEHAYLMLACDEEEGLRSFENLFLRARAARRFAVCDTLVGMADEQRPLLSRNANLRIDYYRGLLAFDIHNFEDAKTIFRQLSSAPISGRWADRAQLYMGLTLEALGSPEEAEEIYRAAIRARDPNASPDFSCRLHGRLANVSLTLGNLKDAEEHARESLRINQRCNDLVGQALNFETLAHVYEKLRDLTNSQGAFDRSLTLFSQAGSQLDRARIYGCLATLQESFGKWSDAEDWYKKALQARADASDDYGLGIVYANLGNLNLKRGQADESLKYFQTALQVFKRFRDRFRSAQVLRNMALAYERLNNFDSSVEHIRTAIQELPESHRLRDSYRNELVRLERISTSRK